MNKMIIEAVVLPILLIVILGYIGYREVVPSRPKNFPPGPKAFPIIGSSKAVSKLDPVTAVAYSKLGEEYGPLTGLNFGSHLGLLVNGYETIKEVLSREEFNGRPPIFNVMVKNVDDDAANETGIMCNNSPSWKDEKSTAKEFLESLFRIQSDSVFETQIKTELQELIDAINLKAEDPNLDSVGIPIMDILNSQVIRFFWRTLTGISADEKELKKLQRLAATFRVSGPLLPVLEEHVTLRMCPYFSKIWKSSVANKSEIRALLQEIVDNQTINEPIDVTEPEKLSFINYIQFYVSKMKTILAEEPNPSYNTPQLIENTNDLFGAGAETMINYLNFGALYMLLYPDVQKRVHEDLDRVIGMYRFPHLDDRYDLPYVMAVAEEILRISGPSPVSMPHASSVEAKLHGYTIPKDTVIVVNYYSAHMDETYWGDPKVFRPERFLDDKKEFIKNERVMPFGYGARSCPGERFARSTFFMFFAALLQNFRIEQVPGTPLPSVVPAIGMTMAPKPFNAALKLRKTEE